ncbi:pilin [Amphibiibacter pelophylacis]|uniref:Pilin n=1 Tax=Amphibiibacter pelophylacis TaxID=1799477 RepID=A0ACC6NXY4_9BURK
MKRKNSGFTLIELMIVVAVIGVLASIATPAFLDYTTRSKVTEGLSLAQGYKTAIMETFTSRGPQNMECLGYNPDATLCGINLGIQIVKPTKNIANVASATNGTITVTFTEAVAPIGKNTLALVPSFDLSQPSVSSQNVVWTCGGTLDPKYLPANCRTAAKTP